MKEAKKHIQNWKDICIADILKFYIDTLYIQNNIFTLKNMKR